MNILILGKGYVGSALFKELQCHGEWSVDWISKAICSYDNREEFTGFLCEWNDKPVYDVVINASGYTGRPNVDACENNIDDTWYYNVTVPGMLGDVCQQHDVHFLQISSGCIYDGYEKAFDERDEPNFGIPCIRSSWYSKTKHAGELALQGTGAGVLRIRMPFCETTSERNIIMKLLKYDNIINQKNSVTNIEDLAKFVCDYLRRGVVWGGVYNVVNPQPITTATIINALKSQGLQNSNWKYIDLEELLEKHTTTGRSNCVLSTQLIDSLDMSLPSTIHSLERCVNSIKNELG